MRKKNKNKKVLYNFKTPVENRGFVAKIAFLGR